MHQYRKAGGPISSRSLMVRRGTIPTQPYTIRRTMPHFPWQARNMRPRFPGSMAIREADHLEGFFDIIKAAGKAVVGVVKSAVGGSTVTLPGGISVPTKDLPTVVKGASVRFGNTPSPVEQAVESVPGGWGTIATVVGGVLLLMGGRGRR
jgi:hypothetical protein